MGFNELSASRLQGVDPRLLEILDLARKNSGINFEVSEGMRNQQRQNQLVASGKSQTKNSRHLTGNATDIHIPDGKGGVNWDFEAYRPIADAAKAAASQLGYDDFTWGGDWKTLKDGVHFQVGANKLANDTMAALGQPQQQTERKPMEPQEPKGLLGNWGIQKMVDGAEGDAGKRFYKRDSFKDTAATMSQAFAALGSNPGVQRFAENVAGQRTESKAKNKTLDYLRANGMDDMANLVENGSMPIGDVMAHVMKLRYGNLNDTTAIKTLKDQAKLAGLQEGTPEFERFMLNGGGMPSDFRALHERALAAGYEVDSQEYKTFMAGRGQYEQKFSGQSGTNAAQVATGGEAAKVVETGKLTAKADSVDAVALKEMRRNMPGLQTVVSELYALSDTATYTAVGQFSDEVAKQMGLEPSEGAIARAKYIATVDNQVLPLLRQTFGAAFTAKEGDTLRSTLGDPNKSPAQKKAVLDSFIAQKIRDLEAMGMTAPQQPQTAPVTSDDPLGLFK